jgi:hypothetical protein
MDRDEFKDLQGWQMYISVPLFQSLYYQNDAMAERSKAQR